MPGRDYPASGATVKIHQAVISTRGRNLSDVTFAAGTNTLTNNIISSEDVSCYEGEYTAVSSEQGLLHGWLY